MNRKIASYIMAILFLFSISMAVGCASLGVETKNERSELETVFYTLLLADKEYATTLTALGEAYQKGKIGEPEKMVIIKLARGYTQARGEIVTAITDKAAIMNDPKTTQAEIEKASARVAAALQVLEDSLTKLVSLTELF